MKANNTEQTSDPQLNDILKISSGRPIDREVARQQLLAWRDLTNIEVSSDLDDVLEGLKGICDECEHPACLDRMKAAKKFFYAWKDAAVVEALNKQREKLKARVDFETEEEQKELTFGQRAVGITFNPGGNPDVNDIKQKYADLIDYHNDALQGETDGEKIRLHKIAITELQGTQMWSVKAITWPPKA